MTVCMKGLELLDAELTEMDRAHVAGCPDCRALLGEEAGTGLAAPPAPPPPAPSPALLSAALEELRARPQATPWTRPLWWLLGLEAGVLLVVGTLFALRAPQPANTAPVGVFVALALGILALLMGMGWLAFRPRWRPGTGPVLAGAAGVVAVGLLWGGSGLQVQEVVPGILHCASVMVGVSVLPLVGALRGLRDLGLHPGRAVAAGLTAAGTGLLLLHVSCPEGTVAHLAFGHLVPWGLLGALLFWVRSRLPTRSHAP